MGWSYNRLWHMLIDRNMMKTDLIKQCGINSNALTHMSKGEPINLVSLGKLCRGLDCRVEDIIEYIPDEEPNGKVEDRE